MDLTFAEALIVSPGDATTKSLFEKPHPGVFWVDWREADDYIVNLAAQALGRDDLSSRWDSKTLHIDFEGRSTVVPLEQKPGEQDIILAALNRALNPQFELRWIRASHGGDTLAFQILSGEDWAALQSRHGASLDAAFARLDPDRPLFQSSEPQVAASPETAAAAIARCASARYRILPAHSPLLTQAEPAPVYATMVGDLCQAFECLDAGAPRLITAADLHAAQSNPWALQSQALQNHMPEWRQLSDSGNGVLSRFHTGDGADTSSLALHPGLWAHYAERGYRFAVAFPRRDLVLFCDATDVVTLAGLVEVVAAFDPDAPDTLSRQIYVWDSGRWAVRAPQAHERALSETPLWKAAERGEICAQYQVASLYDTATHFAEAVRRYQRIVEQVKAQPVKSNDMFENGSAAMCNLADKYEHGKGVAQDPKQARQLYMRSAAFGNCVAQYSLGMMYAAGRGVPVDPELAITWLEQSANQGYEPARSELLRIGQQRQVFRPGS
jgi:hypothetical protein